MNTKKKNAILISLDNSTSEIVQLADTLGYTVLKEFIQHRENPDVNFYIGCGKVDEIKEYFEDAEESFELVIVNGELKPSQWFSLEKSLKLKSMTASGSFLLSSRNTRNDGRLSSK